MKRQFSLRTPLVVTNFITNKNTFELNFGIQNTKIDIVLVQFTFNLFPLMHHDVLVLGFEKKQSNITYKICLSYLTAKNVNTN